MTDGLDPAEAVSVILNYVTAYQTLYRSAKIRLGQRVLIHGASGGIGTAFLQLGLLAGVAMYGTCSEQAAEVVKQLGAIPIDYRNSDFVQEIHRLTDNGVDAVADLIGGDNLWRSREAVREGGRVVVYGFQAKLQGGRISSGAPSGRHPIRESAILGRYILRNWFLPGPQEHGALQYPVADATKTRVVPLRPAHTVRPTAAEKDQATDRTTFASQRRRARARITGKRRRDSKIVLVPE